MNQIDEINKYPQIKDKFFIEEGSPNEIAWLHKSFQNFGGYADSYQIGALSLINDALENAEHRDFQIYPTVFLIRHYIELRLKEFIEGLNFCFVGINKYPTHHDIQNIWVDFKKIYALTGKEVKGEIFQSTNRLILELSSFDPISMSFRYPVDKGGTKIQKLIYVNLNNLKEVFIRLCLLFDGIASEICHYKESLEDNTS